MKKTKNDHNIHAVAIVAADNCTVGHAPYNLAPFLSSFLMRDFNKGSVETIGVRINCGARHGLEVPCIYLLYGTKAYIKALKMAVSKLKEKSLVQSYRLCCVHCMQYIFVTLFIHWDKLFGLIRNSEVSAIGGWGVEIYARKCNSSRDLKYVAILARCPHLGGVH